MEAKQSDSQDEAYVSPPNSVKQGESYLAPLNPDAPPSYVESTENTPSYMDNEGSIRSQHDGYKHGSSLVQARVIHRTSNSRQQPEELSQAMSWITDEVLDPWHAFAEPCSFLRDASIPPPTYIVIPRAVTEFEEESGHGFFATFFENITLVLINFLLWFLIAVFAIWEGWVVAPFIFTFITYFAVFVFPAGCLPKYAPTKFYGYWGGYFLQDGVFPLYMTQEEVSLHEVQGALEHIVMSPPRVVVKIDNYIDHRHYENKNYESTRVATYFIEFAVAHWEDLSPHPAALAEELNRKGGDHNLINLPRDYFLDPEQQAEFDRITKAIASRLSMGLSQKVETTIDIECVRYPDRSLRKALVVGQSTPSYFSSFWFMLSLYTTLYLPYALYARMAVSRYVFPLRRKVSVALNVQPRLISKTGFAPDIVLPRVEEYR